MSTDDPTDAARTTRRGLLSALGRRAAQTVSVPDVPDALRRRDNEAWFDEEPPEWVEPVRSGEGLLSDIHAAADETGVHLWRLGQSGFLLSVAGETVLIDPYLSNTMATLYAETDTPHERICEIPVEPERLSFVDIVLCSNAQPDHLDAGTLPFVLAEHAEFVCSAGSEERAAARGGRPPDVVLDAGASVSLGGFAITAIPAYHADAPEAVGYVVRKGAYAVYFAGNSRRVQGMAEAVAPYGIDAAVLPVSGVNGTMDGADAARLAYQAGAPLAIPCHIEMFRGDTASPSRFVAECVRLGVEYRLPRLGERTTVDHGY